MSQQVIKISDGIKVVFFGEELFSVAVCTDEGVVVERYTVRVLGGEEGIVEGIVEGIFVVVVIGITVVDGKATVEVDIEVAKIVVGDKVVVVVVVVESTGLKPTSHGAEIFAVNGENGRETNERVPIGVLQKFV
uniref:Uncharacterized protein n=1 Tax=Panagrolaimus sp. ES5 TaxID=591445 RepID=A0AC34G3N2_9BILA